MDLNNSERSGKIVAVSISTSRGQKKKPVASGMLLTGFGLEGDVHGGDWHRQVSLLAVESIQKIKDKGFDASPGDFAENITTAGIVLMDIPVGTKLKIGKSAILEVTQIGKKCHSRCSIYDQVGECVMPNEGIFAKVLESGNIQPSDSIEVISLEEIKDVQSCCSNNK